MISRRESERIHSSRHCILQYKEKNLDCELQDISTTGVLVSCRNAAAVDLKNGEQCVLELDDPQLNHRKLKCSVSRHTSESIGLQFLFLDK
ncbi:PilZ domain-containing protein [Pelotalea chapellei]|uniref:PilZ domain-containing protein n=1 Tax=Pelotalea chapellei TaxID=44671 RepID=A0ABS5UBR8_9BACT|nr:PilZ domain-containing protein [Pelotalea chapellei]MBT1073090.1 PilZ domain-containing protein [Pelotalea chapellei]